MTTVPEPAAIKRAAGRTDAQRMGDWLRRICYPLLLPAIVLAVWANAWSAKMEAGRVSLPPDLGPTAQATPLPPPQWSPGYRLSTGDEDDGLASAADDGE